MGNKIERMKVGSLQSGIGGFDYAAELMGWQNMFHCEINPFCQKILNYYWPDAISYGDIKQSDFSEWFRRIDVQNNGFPVRIENKQVIKSACDAYGYVPVFGSEEHGWISFMGVKKVSTEN